jgi:hypothetical protein
MVHARRSLGASEGGAASICTPEWYSGRYEMTGRICTPEWYSGRYEMTGRICTPEWYSGRPEMTSRICIPEWYSGRPEMTSRICIPEWYSGRPEMTGRICTPEWYSGKPEMPGRNAEYHSAIHRFTRSRRAAPHVNDALPKPREEQGLYNCDTLLRQFVPRNGIPENLK